MILWITWQARVQPYTPGYYTDYWGHFLANVKVKLINIKDLISIISTFRFRKTKIKTYSWSELNILSVDGLYFLILISSGIRKFHKSTFFPILPKRDFNMNGILFSSLSDSFYFSGIPLEYNSEADYQYIIITVR